MFRRAFNWMKRKVKSFFGAVVMAPAKVVGAVGDAMTEAALWLYKGTPKYNTIAENLSVMYTDLADSYAERVDYGSVIEEISEEIHDDLDAEKKDGINPSGLEPLTE